MSETAGTAHEAWQAGRLPRNVQLGNGSTVVGPHSFRQFRSAKAPALVIGEHGHFDGVHFALGAQAHVVIGDYCCFTNAMLLCELELRIGSYVMIGFNAALADSDFHPLSPAQRIADAIACSPLGQGRPRPAIAAKPIVIEDNVWIGPNATILKGVRVGAGSVIEPGAVLTREVPPRSRVLGNPGRVVETL
jgi:acetyltransferase-like isoleucine patch superfamily enzyme